MTITRRLVGVAINPHLLRDCAATSLSTVSPAAALSAAALLGHRQFATTERYYIGPTSWRPAAPSMPCSPAYAARRSDLLISCSGITCAKHPTRRQYQTYTHV